MILPAAQLLHLYNAVKTDKHTSEDKSIIVFVSNGDVDSLCTSCLLESILGKSDVPMSILSVESYEQIQEYCLKEGLRDAEDLKTIFMINCGATEDVRELCQFNQNVRVIIIDSHRPIWHGYNVESDRDTLVVLDDDDPVPRDKVPQYDKEEESERDIEQSLRPDDDLAETDEEAEEEEEGGGQGLEQGTEGSGASSRSRKRRAESTADELKHSQEVDSYYEGTSGYGKPSSLLLFQLAFRLHLDDNYYLWLAILGITDQFLHQRMDPTMYTRWRYELQGHVARLNDNLDPEDDEDPYGSSKRKHKFTVVRTESLRLAFLKRWTLSDAMMYNHHVATRMQTWREVGKKQVAFLLAKLNIKVDQHKANYSSMHPAVEPHLREKLPQVVNQFGLNWEMLKYEGFELHFKKDIKIPATDHVLAITAMLGRPRTPERTAQDIFREAIDCLFPDRAEGVELLVRGIERAKELAVQVVEQGGLALTRKQVQGNTQMGFWYLDLSNLTFTGQQEFHHYSTLLKLAIFVRDANTQRFGAPRGMVVVGPPNEKDECYIVSVRHKYQAGVMQNNPFMMPLLEAFKDNATDRGVQSTFDSAIYIIKRPLVYSFCEELKAIVHAYRTGLKSDTPLRDL